MRELVALATSLVVLSACPAGDDGSGDTGGGSMTVGMTAAETDTSTSGMTGMSSSGASSSATTEPAESSSGGSGGGEPPVINSITWTQAPGCVMNTGSDVEITIDAEDPDTDAADLTFSGMAIGCTGEINAATVTILCPQVSTYTADVEVTDPEGGSDSLEIMIVPCMDGSAP